MSYIIFHAVLGVKYRALATDYATSLAVPAHSGSYVLSHMFHAMLGGRRPRVSFETCKHIKAAIELEKEAGEGMWRMNK